MSAGSVRGAVIVSTAFVLAGCESLRAIDFAARSDAPPAALAVAPGPAPAPSDPLLVFVAATGPGGSGVVGGQTVRVARSYTAASGRECREVLIGSGLGERSAVACLDPAMGWSLARPLLRGSGVGRP